MQLRFGAQLIDLLPAGAGAPTGGGGLDHVCLSIQCADLKALREELLAQAVAVEGEVVERRGAYGTGPSLYLRDPDGYLIELKPRGA
jgi:catechol 2,3-dioxygenase-like lactoylglutathione lyase family enzyme